MHHLALSIVAIATAFAAMPAQAQTYAPGFPVCLRVYGPDPYIECAYTSMAQCNASASGRSAQCVVNPYATVPPAVSPQRYRNGY